MPQKASLQARSWPLRLPASPLPLSPFFSFPVSVCVLDMPFWPRSATISLYPVSLSQELVSVPPLAFHLFSSLRLPLCASAFWLFSLWHFRHAALCLFVFLSLSITISNTIPATPRLPGDLLHTLSLLCLGKLLGTGDWGNPHGIGLQAGCSGHWRSLYSWAPPRAGIWAQAECQPHLGIIREREKEGVNPWGVGGAFPGSSRLKGKASPGVPGQRSRRPHGKARVLSESPPSFPAANPRDMRPLHLRLSAASSAWIPKKLLLSLLMAQLWASVAALLPGNDTDWETALSSAQCARGSQPWQVSLFNGLSFHCAGVLVDKSWVLTAAHCWNNKPLWARVGDDHLLLLQGEQLRRTTHPVPHPKYQLGSGPLLPRRTDEHDLMLLKLARPAVLGPRVQIVRLPYSCAQPGDQCQIAGWGTTATRRVKYNRGLSCSRVTILSPKQCEVFYPGVVTNNMMCAGLDQGRDPCQSDSGGPLLCDEVLQGILSWGVYPCGSSQHPAVYTQICKYINWIEKTIRTN